MIRLSRVVVPGALHHVAQSSNRRIAVIPLAPKARGPSLKAGRLEERRRLRRAIQLWSAEHLQYGQSDSGGPFT